MDVDGSNNVKLMISEMGENVNSFNDGLLNVFSPLTVHLL